MSRNVSYSNPKVIAYRGWTIAETPCYPCKWKVVKKGYREDNATWRYVRTVDDAMSLINRREGTNRLSRIRLSDIEKVRKQDEEARKADEELFREAAATVDRNMLENGNQKAMSKVKAVVQVEISAVVEIDSEKVMIGHGTMKAPDEQNLPFTRQQIEQWLRDEFSLSISNYQTECEYGLVNVYVDSQDVQDVEIEGCNDS